MRPRKTGSGGTWSGRNLIDPVLISERLSVLSEFSLTVFEVSYWKACVISAAPLHGASDTCQEDRAQLRGCI